MFENACPNPTQPDQTPGAVWLRPEFQGRDDELANLANGADLVGVGRAAVSNRAKGHHDFPKLGATDRVAAKALQIHR